MRGGDREYGMYNIYRRRSRYILGELERIFPAGEAICIFIRALINSLMLGPIENTFLHIDIGNSLADVLVSSKTTTP